MLEQLIAACRGRVVDLRLLADEPPPSQIAACRRALAAGAAVVIGGWLPADPVGHRVGPPRPAGPRRGPAGPPGLPPGRGQVAQDHRARRRRRAGGRRGATRGLVRYSHPAPTRPPQPRSAARLGHALRLGSRERRLPPARALPPDAGGAGFAAEPRLGGGDRHRPARSTQPGAGLGRPRPSRWSAPSPAASPRAGGCAACWSATTTSSRSGWTSPGRPGDRPATRRPIRRRWSGRSSTPSAPAAPGGSAAAPSWTPTT